MPRPRARQGPIVALRIRLLGIVLAIIVQLLLFLLQRLHHGLRVESMQALGRRRFLVRRPRSRTRSIQHERQRNLLDGSELPAVVAVFVFETKEIPLDSSNDFEEGEEVCCYAPIKRVLPQSCRHVDDPGDAKQEIRHDSLIVHLRNDFRSIIISARTHFHE